MSWRDKMSPASFRGVIFFVESSELSGGRRTVRNEYPKRDESFSEDMGRKSHSFPVEGFLVGDGYIEEKNRLIEKLEEYGPGELIHPYYGAVNAICSDFRVRESSDEGGVARFSIVFDETPAQPIFPSAVSSGIDKVESASSSSRSAIESDFLARYSPGVLMESAADKVRSITLALDNAKTMSGLTVEEAASMLRRLDRMASSATSLVETPAELFASLSDTFSGIADIGAVIASCGFDQGDTPPSTTENRIVEVENLSALNEAILTLAVIRAAEIASTITYDSYESAVAQRDEISSLLDDRMESAEDDVYSSLEELRASLVIAVPGVSSDLPHLISHTPAATIPSLVIAYQLYGDVSMEPDIVARNRIKRPGFIPGGREIEVLSDAG
jgi:prophage DNA circulation protein